MERTLDLQTLSTLTKRKIRDAVGAKSAKGILKLAKQQGAELLQWRYSPEIQERLAYRYFGAIENELIAERNKVKKDAKKLKKSVIATIITNSNSAYNAIKQSYIQKKSINAIFISDGEIIRNLNYDFRNEDEDFSTIWGKIKHDLQPETDKDIFDDYPNGKLYITVGNDPIPSNVIQTAFFDGKINCLIKAIIDFGNEKVKTVKSNKNYVTFVNKAKVLEQKYHDIGVNTNAIDDICNNLQIDIQVDLPFQKEFIVCKSSKKSLRTFHFVNTRMNHVDFDEVSHTDNKVIMTQEELLQKWKQLNDDDIYNTYTKSSLNINRITTNDAVYTLPNEYNEIVEKFEIESGLLDCKLCDIKNKDVSEFIRQGVHLCETTIHMNYLDEQVFYHIDMEKAYVNYEKSKYYEGFLGKVTEFRYCNKIVDIGYYLIENLQLHGRIAKWNKVLKCFYDNVYPSPVLKMLEKEGCTFKIVAGCWGSKINFVIPQELVNFTEVTDKKNKLRGYCKWVGKSMCRIRHNSFYMKANNDFITHLSKEINANFEVFDNEVKVSFPKQSNYHLSHIAGMITGYMLTNVLEQLFEFEPEDIIKICTDGIYHTKKDVALKNCFRVEKREKITKNAGAPSYLSNPVCKRKFNIGQFKEDNNMVEVHLGCGGSGKTHKQLTDDGYVNVLYLAPSWKLARVKQKEYGIRCDTIAKGASTDPETFGALKRFNNVVVVDEVSMMSNEAKNQILRNFEGCKIIFCGDIGFQLPCFDAGTTPFCVKGMKIINHTNNYRVKCPTLLGLLNEIREMMEQKINIVSFVKSVFRNVEEFEYNHNKDMILCRTHEHNDIYNEKYKHLEKYYITKSDRTYGRGEIYFKKPDTEQYEIRHSFTIHCIQGETAEGNLFINMKGMKNNQSLYTALSRAKYWNQIHLVMS